MAEKVLNTKFYADILALLQTARNNVLRAVNQTIVLTYLGIGRMIMEEEQQG
ncbi:MAG: hypothetical protein IPF46_16280 [Saprospiraceae bacterium]|nr:hypothetical protein [Candidatus Vicinibacter affinis]